MTSINIWAQRWGLPPQAFIELLQALGADAPPQPEPTPGLTSEAGVQQQVRLVTARRGARLWRNNNGACTDETGRLIRYGLANDSPQVSAVFKSSDLIGITPIRCACGQTHGVFTAYECKAPGWKYRQSDKRAVAQLNFIKLVVSLGGIARFVSDPTEVL